MPDRKKIIFLLSRFPWPLVKGDKLRAYHQIVELSKSCDVYLFALSDEKVSNESIDALRPYCKEIKIYRLNWIRLFLNVASTFLFTKKPIQTGYFYNAAIARKFRSEVERIKADNLICQLIRTARYAQEVSGIHKTLDYMDALSAGMERRAESAGTL